MSSSGAEQQPWHASPALLVAFSLGRARLADAWSVEAHLASCGPCRAELARVVAQDDDDRRVLALARERVLVTPPQPADVGVTAVPGRLRAGARQVLARSGAPWHLRWALRPTSLGAVALAVAAAVAFAGVTHRVVSPESGTAWLLWALAPAVPVAGVALSSVAAGAEHEVELSTPSAGWRLVLWRTLAVLAAAVPMALVGGLLITAVTGPGPAEVLAGTPGVSGAWLPVLWLLPALALTATALAVGTWLPLARSAVLVGLAWVFAVVGVPVLQPGEPAGGALRVADGVVPGQLGAPGPVDAAWSVHLLSGWAQPLWLLVLAAALAVVLVRRDALGTPSGRSRWREGGGAA
ncbi:hypothetical protein ACUN7V_12460 [Quadrisphaera oryzae]|uniref:hypothetical protein n=1 Tax=Quadrisphaera TaxID=317661 RepID=UPI0016462816|nr:hypothetical protein [Quadrisphaera sp. RL12-1S]MBC3762019.1 hypothetical protein [Quadrisphaera sp. RL12-1S]